MKRLLGMFLTLVLVLAATAGAAASGYTYADTVDWQGEYDVVVVGFGGAGAVAARTAADSGAKVLIVEKAPEGDEGGNTRYSGQFFVYGNGNYEDTYAYYKALGGTHAVPEAMLEVYARGITNLADTVAGMFNLDTADFKNSNDWPYTQNMSPEYPELPGSGSISLMATHDGFSDGHLWGLMRQAIIDRSDSVDVWFESPAVHLIQDPISKTIVGVEVTRGGETLNIRAKNGVVLACGGFENNKEMVETYLGLAEFAIVGTLYNTGDGVRMAQEVGADLWHMHVYEGITNLGASSKVVGEGQRAVFVTNPYYSSGSAILISGAGTRFLREDEILRHGHLNNGDVYVNPSYPQAYYVLMDEAQYQAALAVDAQMGSAYAFLDGYEYTTAGSGLEDLAEKMGLNAETLRTTITNYNLFAETGVDYQFGRAAETMSPIDMDGALYAVKLIPNILNTQGGPKRNENAEVLDTAGNPIPRLYSAGELGGICSLQYQGGGNIAECLIFGQIAGANAAAEKDALPEYTALQSVESTITYTPGAVNDLIRADLGLELNENQVYGEGTGMGGTVGVVVTLDGDVIAAIDVVIANETPGIGTPAIEQMPAKIIEAQSTDVDTVSGSTITSGAIIEAVNNALAK